MSSSYFQIFQNKKVLYTLIVIAVVVISIATALAMTPPPKSEKKTSIDTQSHSKDGSKDSENVKEKDIEPVYIESPINGIMLEEQKYSEIKNRNVAGVVVQNHIDSRPQYGLNEADIVYETLAEGGITRFMGMFWSEKSEKIMSVRSARKYFVDILGDYKDPLFMHIGYATGANNVNAANAISRYNVKDIAFSRYTSFYRDKTCQQKKAIEHCAYTSTDLIWKAAEKMGYDQDIEEIEKLEYIDNDSKESKVGTLLLKFKIQFSKTSNSNPYSAFWKYSESEDQYYRYNHTGAKYLDAYGKPVTSKVIVVQNIRSVYMGDPKGRLVQDVIGKGAGYVMQKGKVYKIEWQKNSYESRTKYFISGTEKPFKFNRGKMWISWVSNELSYIEY